MLLGENSYALILRRPFYLTRTLMFKNTSLSSRKSYQTARFDVVRNLRLKLDALFLLNSAGADDVGE